MNKFYCIILSFISAIYTFAQRGTVRPEDLGYESEEYYTTSTNYGAMILFFVIVFIAIIAIIMIKGKIERNAQSKKYKTKRSIRAYHSMQDYVNDKYGSIDRDYVDTILIKEGEVCNILKKAENGMCYACFEKQRVFTSLLVPLEDLERIY